MKQKALAPGQELEAYCIPLELDPNAAQAKLIAQAMGARRFAWNRGLAWINARAVEPNGFAMTNHHNSTKAAEVPWSGEVSKHCFEEAFADLGQAFKNWFKNPKHFGRPDWKRKGQCEETCRLRGSMGVSGRKLKLPTIGKVRFKEDPFALPEGEKVLSITLKRTAGHYYATLRMERVVAAKPLPHPDQAVYKGVDSGIKAAMTTYDGEKTEFIQAPRPLRWHARKLKRLQRRLARKQRGSKNRAKERAKVARQNHRIARVRQASQHKAAKGVATSPTGKPCVVGVEDAAWKNLFKNHRLAGALADVGISATLKLIQYKTDRGGGVLVKVGRFFPSTKLCSHCGHVKEKMTLSERTYRCEACGLTMDRDENAARNIRAEAMRIYREVYYSRSVPPERREAAGMLPRAAEGQTTGGQPARKRGARRGPKASTGETEPASHVKNANDEC